MQDIRTIIIPETPAPAGFHGQCKRGHDLAVEGRPRKRGGAPRCYACDAITRKTWRRQTAQIADRRDLQKPRRRPNTHWARFLRTLDTRIATIRAEEGFDSRELAAGRARSRRGTA